MMGSQGQVHYTSRRRTYTVPFLLVRSKVLTWVPRGYEGSVDLQSLSDTTTLHYTLTQNGLGLRACAPMAILPLSPNFLDS